MTQPATAQAAVTDPATATPPTPTPPAATPPPATPAAANGATDWQAEAEKYKALAKKHEDRGRIDFERLTQQETALKAIAEKLGVDVTGQPDPAQLTTQLTAAQQAARNSALELAVYRAAGPDADRLIDSRQFMSRTAGLDPTAADFADQVKAKAAEFLAANPAAAVPAADPAPAPVPVLPATSGGNFGAAPTGPRQWTDADVQNASPEDLSKAIDQGLLAGMGVGRPKGRWR